MLGYYRAVEVDEDLGFWTHHPLPLLQSEQRVAIHAAVETALFVLKEKLELLHEQLRCELVFLVLKSVKVVN